MYAKQSLYVSVLNLFGSEWVHLRLIVKRLVDFLLVIIELFSLGVTAEDLRANIDWKF